MPIKDLAAVVEQLKHFQLTAVGGDHYVAVVFAQELHVQNLVAVADKLRGGERERGCKLILPSLTCRNILAHVRVIPGFPLCIASSYLLQCGKAGQLVQHYVVFRCDCSQSQGGRQEKEMCQTAGVSGLLLLLLLVSRFPLFNLRRDTGEGLAKDATCCVRVPHLKYAFKEEGGNMSDRNTDTLQITIEVNLCCQQ